MQQNLMSCDSRAVFRRAELLRSIRGFFDGMSFCEVETPLLSRDTVVDRHLDPVEVWVPSDAREKSNGTTCYLQTSPEFGMKRLLASGLQSIYQITRAFRLGEQSQLHNLEFTMLEWYRVGDDYEAGMDLLKRFACHILEADKCEAVRYREAFQANAGIDPFEVTLAELRQLELQVEAGEMPTSDERELLLDVLFTERVQPGLGVEFPVVVCDYPASQAALAKTRIDVAGAAVAERFELFFKGVELANGYHELTDPAELRRRNREVNEQRVRDGKSKLPSESALLGAMELGLPECSGVALGVDRLLMLLMEVEQISEVLCLPFERA